MKKISGIWKPTVIGKKTFNFKENISYFLFFDQELRIKCFHSNKSDSIYPPEPKYPICTEMYFIHY